jgi:uncharacterized protein YeaO (DUF488 family)
MNTCVWAPFADLGEGVPRAEYASRNFYDVWLPILSPSQELMKQGRSARNEKEWSAFHRKFRSEMNVPDAGKILDLLAAISPRTDFSGDATVTTRVDATDRS